MIRRILMASAGAFALTGAAFAADLPSRAPPPVFLPPPPLWTGFYLGINAGYEWSASTGINTATANVFSLAGLNGNIGGAVATLATGNHSLSPNGFIGGGQIGYNYQFANSWVAGLEADFDGIAGAHRVGSFGQTGFVPGAAVPIADSSIITWRKSVDYLGTVRGRIGYLATPTLLIYGTGGLAYGGVNANTGVVERLGFGDTPAPFGTFGSVANTRIGWTAGGGAEWMFLPNWSAKIEYLYYDLGNATYRSALPQFGAFGTLLETIGVTRTSTRFNGNVVRVGLNYHFSWGAAPVVAKY
ncbi:MAG TPA: outer membrane beta-barrel protein [Methylocella sp.]|jgi:outer membrane immunogenic protein